MATNAGKPEKKLKPRTSLHVPTDSKLFKIISETESKEPKWKLIEDRLLETDRDELCELIFNEFVSRLCLFYPEKKEKLMKLYGLVMLKIIYGDKLKEAYIKEIEKIMNE
jgi:hypothetical protein